MSQLKPTRTVYTVTDFIGWQRSGELQLKPIFQRREVWGPKAKSLLIDTVVKGLPVPIIFLRKAQNLDTLSSIYEVVDGQQRLRTLFAFIDPQLLRDFKDDPSVVAALLHRLCKSMRERDTVRDAYVADNPPIYPRPRLTSPATQLALSRPRGSRAE